jgi:hypothetical protein
MTVSFLLKGGKTEPTRKRNINLLYDFKRKIYRRVCKMMRNLKRKEIETKNKTLSRFHSNHNHTYIYSHGNTLFSLIVSFDVD